MPHQRRARGTGATEHQVAGRVIRLTTHQAAARRGFALGGGSGFRAAVARVFGDGENPLAWGIPLFTVAGIRVRLHVFFLVYVVTQLIYAALPSQSGLRWTAPMLTSLCVLVLLHEFGHCLACRRVGGEADEVMLWPLGGLASCRPPEDGPDPRRPDLITTLGGPAVNLALLPVLGVAVLLAAADWRVVVFNPFEPGPVLSGLVLRDGTQPWWLVWLWSAHYANAILFLFNMLVPMFPMDAGRVVHALLWRSRGRGEATLIVCTLGLFVAGVLAVVGVVTAEVMFVLIAGFGGLTCWMERQRIKLLGLGGVPGVDFVPGSGYAVPTEPVATAAERRAARREQHQAEREERKQEQARVEAAAAQAELDRVLAKISASGMSSLTRDERAVLERATRDRAAGAGPGKD